MRTETRKTQQIEEQQRKEKADLLSKETEHRDMIDSLLKQKEELKKQKNQLNAQKMKVVTEVEYLESMENDKTLEDEVKGLASPGYIKLEEMTLKYKQLLYETVKELDQLVLNTEKLLADTEDVIRRTTEKKNEAETSRTESKVELKKAKIKPSSL